MLGIFGQIRSTHPETKIQTAFTARCMVSFFKPEHLLTWYIFIFPLTRQLRLKAWSKLYVFLNELLQLLDMDIGIGVFWSLPLSYTMLCIRALGGSYE